MLRLPLRLNHVSSHRRIGNIARIEIGKGAPAEMIGVATALRSNVVREVAAAFFAVAGGFGGGGGAGGGAASRGRTGGAGGIVVVVIIDVVFTLNFLQRRPGSTGTGTGRTAVRRVGLAIPAPPRLRHVGLGTRVRHPGHFARVRVAAVAAISGICRVGAAAPASGMGAVSARSVAVAASAAGGPTAPRGGRLRLRLRILRLRVLRRNVGLDVATTAAPHSGNGASPRRRRGRRGLGWDTSVGATVLALIFRSAAIAGAAGTPAAVGSGGRRRIVSIVGGDSLPLHGLVVVIVEVVISGGFLFGAPQFVEHGHVCECVGVLGCVLELA